MSSFDVASTKVLPIPVSPQSDKKDYRVIELSNGLRALLISDTSYDLDKLNQEEEDAAASATATDGEEDEEDESGSEEEEDDGDDEADGTQESSGLKKSAAGMCIGMGSFSDPQDLPGLAHFLEHMVFMGSTKYPDENAFDQFIQKHGGYDNAHTDTELTTFYFEVQRRNFREALDRFAQFFVNPLMKRDAMQREREAVDSEFQMSLPSDGCRKQQLMGSIAAKPGHPLGNFMWGNLESLGNADDEQTHKKLHDFRLRHYTAQSMTLAVQSQETLDTLEKWVKESFFNVQNNGLKAENFASSGNPFGPESKFHKIYKIVPVKDIHQLDLYWALPSMLHRYRVDPLNYLSHIVGYEGKGSLISFLRKKVWALSLSAGNANDGFESNEAYSSFSINIALTKSGQENIDKVLEAVFSYLKMLRSQRPSERIFEELKKIKKLDFEFGPEPQAVDNVENLCEGMQLYPPEMYLTGGELLFDFDEKLIYQCCQGLNEDDVCICLTSKDYKDVAVKSEKWFKTRYVDEEITAEQLAAWKNAPLQPELFFLPEPNIYIAENVSLLPEVRDNPVYPVEVLSNEFGHLYYRQDDKFKGPRGVVSFNILSPKFKESAEAGVLLDLLVYALDLLMIEDIYPATQALLDYSISIGERGEFNVRVSGLNDKLPNLLKTILDHLSNFEQNISDDTFCAVKEQTKRNYFNFFIKPSRVVRDLRLQVLQDCYWSAREKHAVIDTITLDQMNQFVKEFCCAQQAFVQGLVQGNITKQAACDMFQMVTGVLKGDPKRKTLKDMVDISCKEIPVGKTYLRTDCYDPKNTNTMVVNYYQYKPGSLKEMAVLQVIELLMEEPVFDILRTKEQLGYSVFCMIRNTYGTLAMSIAVNSQATKFTVDHVDERIEAFLDWFIGEKLKNLADDDFQQSVATLVKALSTADVRLSEEFNRNWSEMKDREYAFDRRQKTIQYLESLKKEEMVQLATTILGNKETKRKFSVQVVGNPDGIKIQEQEEDIPDIDPNGTFDLVLLNPEAHFIQSAAVFKSKLKTYPATLITKV